MRPFSRITHVIVQFSYFVMYPDFTFYANVFYPIGILFACPTFSYLKWLLLYIKALLITSELKRHVLVGGGVSVLCLRCPWLWQMEYLLFDLCIPQLLHVTSQCLHSAVHSFVCFNVLSVRPCVNVLFFEGIFVFPFVLEIPSLQSKLLKTSRFFPLLRSPVCDIIFLT